MSSVLISLEDGVFNIATRSSPPHEPYRADGWEPQKNFSGRARRKATLNKGYKVRDAWVSARQRALAGVAGDLLRAGLSRSARDGRCRGQVSVCWSACELANAVHVITVRYLGLPASRPVRLYEDGGLAGSESVRIPGSFLTSPSFWWARLSGRSATRARSFQALSATVPFRLTRSCRATFAALAGLSGLPSWAVCDCSSFAKPTIPGSIFSLSAGLAGWRIANLFARVWNSKVRQVAMLVKGRLEPRSVTSIRARCCEAGSGA